jgi:exodeoxyribonuclease V gamma subunit
VTLRVHRSERADVLVQGLATVLRDAPADPFTPEVVAVPTRGVERWITQTLSATLGTGEGGDPSTDGVCANVLFPSPGRLVGEALAAGTGVDPRDDPWAERRLTWVVLEVVDDCGTEEWCATLGRHLGLLGDTGAAGRRAAVAQKLAGLFCGYAAQRPAMLRDWAAGRDTDGAGGTLEPDLAWQAELWRRVRAAVGTDSPAERLGPACRRLVERPGELALPERLSLFGPTRVTTEQLEVLRALAAHREVHLWLPHSSHRLWDRLRDHVGEQVATEPPGPAPPPRRHDETADLPVHPLLRSCARDAREMQLRLGAVEAGGRHGYLPPPDHGGSDTLLAALQRDVREDREPTAVALRPGDRSVQVHACHGRQRQVEVLRELLVGMLQDDPSLELRDVVVMCPDIETYAPLVSAAFDDLGALEGADPGSPLDRGHEHPGHRLRVRLADRSLRQTNPVLTVVARLLELADARLTASEVLDLAAMPPVRRRFGLDDDALELAGDWVRRSGVRWGLDADARAPYHLSSVRQNTWRAGLDRILVGAAMDEAGLRPLGLALPLDDVDSNDVDLAGRLAELLDRLALAVAALRRDQPLTAWVEALVTAVGDLTDVAPADAWQLTEARRQLGDALVAAGGRGATVPLGLPDLRSLLAHRLRGRPTRANFRTGHLTMCTMLPMRSVPHRTVVLLGLDDGVFPRATRLDGDDVLARTPLVGERDPRAEDRQLFLDAVLAAGERLVVLYTGADERTGAVRPPAVPLGELLDVVARMTGDASPVCPVLVRHPLQPFDARSFVAGALGGAGVLSFDTASYAGAAAMRGPRAARGPFLDRPLSEPPPTDVVSLEDLTRFLEHPVRGFLRQRLGLATPGDQEEGDDAIPVEVGPLALWAVGDRVLRAGLAGVGRDDAVRAERLRGELPPGALGDAVVAPVAHEVEVLVDRTARLRAGGADAVDVSVDLPGGVRVAGTVPGVHDERVVRVEYSRLGARHRLRAWVQLLALVAARPGREWCAATVGRGRDAGRPVMSALTAPAEEEARRLLAALVHLRGRGLCEPLPLAPKTSCAYAELRGRGSPPAAAVARAAGEWRRERRDGSPFGDFADPEHVRVWGEVELRDLVASRPPRAGEAFEDEPHLFGQLARQVWSPLLAHEVLH